MLCKSNRELTYEDLERKFREANFAVYVVALVSTSMLLTKSFMSNNQAEERASAHHDECQPPGKEWL